MGSPSFFVSIRQQAAMVCLKKNFVFSFSPLDF